MSTTQISKSNSIATLPGISFDALRPLVEQAVQDWNTCKIRPSLNFVSALHTKLANTCTIMTPEAFLSILDNPNVLKSLKNYEHSVVNERINGAIPTMSPVQKFLLALINGSLVSNLYAKGQEGYVERVVGADHLIEETTGPLLNNGTGDVTVNELSVTIRVALRISHNRYRIHGNEIESLISYIQEFGWIVDGYRKRPLGGYIGTDNKDWVIALRLTAMRNRLTFLNPLQVLALSNSELEIPKDNRPPVDLFLTDCYPVGCSEYDEQGQLLPLLYSALTSGATQYTREGDSLGGIIRATTRINIHDPADTSEEDCMDARLAIGITRTAKMLEEGVKAELKNVSSPDTAWLNIKVDFDVDDGVLQLIMRIGLKPQTETKEAVTELSLPEITRIAQSPEKAITPMEFARFYKDFDNKAQDYRNKALTQINKALRIVGGGNHVTYSEDARVNQSCKAIHSALCDKNEDGIPILAADSYFINPKISKEEIDKVVAEFIQCGWSKKSYTCIEDSDTVDLDSVWVVLFLEDSDND